MSNRTALVVGGTSGIGLATARQLHTRGATVHIAGRGKERLETWRRATQDWAATRPTAASRRRSGPWSRRSAASTG